MAHYEPEDIELSVGHDDRNDATGDINETSFIEQPITNEPQQLPAGALVDPLGQELLKGAVDNFYEYHRKAYRVTPALGIDYSKFTYDGARGLRLKAYPEIDIKMGNGKGKPYALSTLNARAQIALEELGFVGWNGGVRSKNAKGNKILADVAQAATVGTTSADGSDIVQGATAAINALDDPNIIEALNAFEDPTEHETAVKTIMEQGAERGIPDSIMDRELSRRNLIPMREIRGLKKAFTLIREQVVNHQAKISEIDFEITRRERKIKEAPSEETRRDQEKARDALIEEKNTHLQMIRALRVQSQNQLTHIRESITHFLKDDTKLGERLRNLFREQGVTIVSILTAIGMVISTFVLAITGGGVVTPPPPAGADKAGIKVWVKQRLQDLGRLLAKLAEKAAAALPGIIGSIVSWLLSTAQKAVGWLAENLWTLAVGIAGLLYLTARDYIFAKKLTPPKKE